MKLRLSEAIRLGSMLKPQGFEALTTYIELPRTTIPAQIQFTCAIGAAYDAAGVLDDIDILPDVDISLGWADLFLTPARCPECRDGGGDVENVIICLNDNHRWSRGRIADFVETIERAHEAKRQTTEEAILVA